MSSGNFEDAIYHFDQAESVYESISELYSAMIVTVDNTGELFPSQAQNNGDDEDDDGDGDVVDGAENTEGDEDQGSAPTPPANAAAIDRNLHFLQHYPGFIVSLKSRGQCLEFTKCYAAAETLYLRVMAVMEFVRGKHHPDYSSVLNSMGLLKLHTGCLDDAAGIFQTVNYLEVLNDNNFYSFRPA
jgi:hypothetical protein